MAYQRKKRETKKQAAERTEPINVTECKVTRARVWKDGNETFDMVLNGVSIYGCRLVEGKNGLFVSYPARKGNDGNYYSHCYAVLSEETVDSIARQVDELLDKEEAR